MKKRFRHYARNGWEVVEVSRANLYQWDGDGQGFGNDRHYQEMQEWCMNRLPKESWQSTLLKSNGIKKFAFKAPRYATMFRLQWM